MSIEGLLEALRTSIDANTAALTAAGSGAPAAAAGGKGGAAAAKVTQEQVNAALIKIKDSFGMDEAKAVIKQFGKCDKMAEIKPAAYQAVYDGAVAAHARLSEGTNDI